MNSFQCYVYMYIACLVLISCDGSSKFVRNFGIYIPKYRESGRYYTFPHFNTHDTGRRKTASALFPPAVRSVVKNSAYLWPELQNNQDLETVDTLLPRFRIPIGQFISVLFTNDQYHVCKLLKQNVTFRWVKVLKKEPKKNVMEMCDVYKDAHWINTCDVNHFSNF